MVVEADNYLTEAEARQLYQTSDSAHNFDHILRVARLGERIAEAEGADITVVRLAALLHDVPVEDGGRADHQRAAAEFARNLLEQRKLGTERINNVVHCIESHRFRHRTVAPRTQEAFCLYDADKLDSIGAIGVARTFAYAGTYQNRLWHTPQSEILLSQQLPTGAEYTPVHEFIYKLQHLVSTLHTASARRIGAERHAVMVAFFEQLDQEMRGFA